MIILYLMVALGAGLSIVKHNRENKEPHVTLTMAIFAAFGWPIILGYILIDNWSNK